MDDASEITLCHKGANLSIKPSKKINYKWGWVHRYRERHILSFEKGTLA